MILAIQRQRAIVGLVTDQGVVDAAELCHRFAVSPATIRRDLRDLASRGLVQRVHGGAVLTATAPVTDGWPEPSRSNQEIDSIGAIAARMVRPGDCVGLSAGEAAVAMAAHLTVDEVTVVTNSVAVAHALPTRADLTLVLIGGEWDRPSGAQVGPLAVRALRGINLDTFFLAPRAVGEELMAHSAAEAQIDQALIACSRRVVVLAAPSALNAAGVAPIAASSIAHSIIGG